MILIKKSLLSMRQIAIFLMLLWGITLQAQHIESGTHWYNGAIIYTASPLQSGNVLMSATVEGEEIEFMLVPESDKLDIFHTAQGPNDGYMPYEEGVTVKHFQEEDFDVLCFYDTSGSLFRLLSKTDEVDNKILNELHWMGVVRGTYRMPDDTRVTIDWDKANVGGVYIPVEAVTFNGHTTGLISFNGEGTPLSGPMEVIYTIDGLELHAVYFDDYGTWHRLPGDGILLTECDPDSGRFDFANNMLLYGNELYDFDEHMLRLMRNSILACHGYVFQSKDLKEYFGNEPWYHPADNNDDINLSIIERLNIELIKNQEK